MNYTLSLLLLAPAAEPVFTAHAGGEARPRGPLVKLEADWSVTLGGAKPVRSAGGDLIWLRRADAKLPARPAGTHVRFINGDVLPGEAISLANDRLRFRTPVGELTLPLATLSALWLAQPADRGQALAIQRLLAEPRNRDLVWLKNGDTQEGTVLGLDGEALTLDVAGKPVKVERAKLAVIGLNTELARLDRPKQAFARLTLADGARISLVSAQLARQTLNAKALFGGVIQAPLEQIVALDVEGGRSIFLSDLKPKAYQETPYFEGARWSYRLDREVAGHELRLAGSAYDKGIGMHSASRLTYALNGQFRFFECLVGLDEVAGKLGRAQVGVLVDGKPQNLGWNGDLKAGAAQAVRVNVSGAKEMTLLVEYGADGLDVEDHVNWADARLIR